ncbi:hypothetical protein L3Q82_011307, partial [Scortum barcoo]
PAPPKPEAKPKKAIVKPYVSSAQKVADDKEGRRQRRAALRGRRMTAPPRTERPRPMRYEEGGKLTYIESHA